jgi:type I restriction enzyme R subunit
MTEDQLEQETLGWLTEAGYSTLYGPDIAPDGDRPERNDYRQVLLVERLRSAVERLNPAIPTAAREDAIQQVVDLGTPVLLSANRRFHQLLVGGVPVQYQKDNETRGNFVRLIDWAEPSHNEWLAINQFSIKGAHHTRRPDVILFVNGLPLVLLELKNPADENADIWKAYDQIQTYKEQIPDVFQYNEVLVISDGSEARLGSLQVNTRQDLRVKLANRPSGGIIFATIQKFMPGEDEDHFPMLSNRSNIVVIADEAHRTQYGFEAKLKTIKMPREAANDAQALKAAQPHADYETRYQVGYAQHLRDALPNATFVAFTGTPVSSEDRDTRAVFGDYIHIYDMQQSKEDGATVAIYFESRLAKLSLKTEELAQIDDEVDELAEDEEESQQSILKSRWAALEKVVGAEPRIASVAADLVAHFEERSKAQTGKAMIVAMSREICVHLYNEIIKLRPDWHDADPEKGVIKIVMTGSASDKALLRPHIYSGQVKKRLEKRFKDPADPMQLVIVRDMWLTGFDAPCVHTLYVDKPMKGHNLMQAIARVNRVFKDKQGGLVVDYIGIANELRSALKEYTNSSGRGRPTVDAAEAYAVLEEKLDILRGLLHGYDYSDFLTASHKRLAGAANHVLGEKDGKKRFADTALAMSKAFTLCCTLDEAKAVREEVAFFQAVKVILTKRDISQQKKTNEERELAIRQIIGSAVVSEEVVDVFNAVGLDKPNIDILDDAFLAEVRNLPEKNLAVELLERLLEGEIKTRFAGNIVQGKKFSDLLANVVKRYQNRAIETAQVIEELIAMAKKFREAAGRGDVLGLSEDEIRFYDALADNESAVRELSDETLKKIAHELTENLRQNLTVDWSARESVRAKLRLMVKRILRKYKYPPDLQEAAIELVLQQAQAMGEAWSN